MELQLKIVCIIRFAITLFSLVTALFLMIRADDNRILRWGSFLAAVGLICFNRQISEGLYLVIVSTLETLCTIICLGAVLSLGLVIMLFPIIAVVRWLTH